MLITATTVILFLVVALAAVAVGHWIRSIPIYAFGILLLFLFSGFVWYNGISEQTGSTIVDVTNTTTTVTAIYDQNRPLWIDLLSVASMLLATILSILTFEEYKKEKLRKEQEEIDVT